MRRLLCAATVALGALASAASSAAAPGTLRLDYFHTGGRGVEIFAVDRVTREPLPWPGHPERTVNDGNQGVYRFEVRDANYDARAFYRTQLDCVMFTRNVVPFCQVCQRALEQVIDLHAGPRSAD